MFVTNAENEAEIGQVLREIILRTPKIRLSKRLNGKEGQKKSAFIVQLASEDERYEIMEKKARYLKDKKSRIGINRALTRKQIAMEKERRDAANEENGNTQRPNKSDIRCRFGARCNQNYCSYAHPTKA